MFAPSFYDQLEDRLNLAVHDINNEWRNRMPIEDAYVNAHLPPLIYANKPNTTDEKPRMNNITGIQPGAFQSKLTEMRQKIADKQTEALTKIDGAVTSGAAKMNAAVDDVILKADKEVDAALHEFAQFTNGPEA